MATSLATLRPNPSGHSQDEQIILKHVEDDVVTQSPRSRRESIVCDDMEVDEDYCTEPGQVITTRLVIETCYNRKGVPFHVLLPHGIHLQKHHPSEEVLEPPETGPFLPFGRIVYLVSEKQAGEEYVHVRDTTTGKVGFLSLSAASSKALTICPGGALMGARWRFRVVCTDGAFVREGEELTSARICVLPCLSIVEVEGRCINSQGLPRLLLNSLGQKRGWISEVLNPLSGQRGPVVEIIPLIAPLRYGVMLPIGASVRSSTELGSRFIRNTKCGETVIVCTKRFSDFPPHCCLQRLRTSDGGWISMRLNRDPPDDLHVVRLQGVFKGGDKQQQQQQQPSNFRNTAVSCREDGSFLDLDDRIDETVSQDLAKVKGGKLVPEDLCVICLSQPRTSTLVHGTVGHIVCCLECARILKARGDPCPVCRQEVDSVIQHFWA